MTDTLRAAVERAVRKSGVGARRWEAENGLPEWALHGLLDKKRKQSPSLDRAHDICKALGLELDLRPSGEVRRDAPPPFMQGDGDDFTCPWPVPLSSDESDYPESGYAPVGCVFFGSRFLERADLDPWSCEVARLTDDSMAPSLPEGTFVLVDRRRKRREEGLVYRVRHNRKALVRRADKIGRSWKLLADDQEQQALAWDRSVETIGQVVWMGRVFVPMTPRDA